jgi:hypothetical protein
MTAGWIRLIQISTFLCLSLCPHFPQW